MKRRHSFTIIEILVVMAIIIVLMALLMTGWSVAMGRARKTQAKSDITLLRTAVAQYQTNYPSANMPFSLGYGTTNDLLLTGTTTPSTDDLLSCFGGKDSASNPRQIIMVEIGVAQVDPWGNAYRVALDNNADGSISDDKIYGSGILDKEVAVWSAGPDGKDSAIDNDPSNKDNITSW